MRVVKLLSLVRLLIVPLALIQLLNARGAFPAGYEAAAWTILGLHVLGAFVLIVLAFTDRFRRRIVAVAGIAFDLLLSTALILVYSFESGQPFRTLLFLVILEAALLYRLVGGLIAALVGIPILTLSEVWRSSEFGFEIQPESVVLRVAVGAVLGIVVGRLVELEREQAALARDRAQEAERLRDELGRRVDVLEASNRCARALGSSLELDQAFGAFIAELRGPRPLRAGVDPPARGRSRDGDGDRRCRCGLLSRSRKSNRGSGLDPRAGRRRPNRGSSRPRGAALSGGGRSPSAGPALTRGGTAPARRRARSARSRSVARLPDSFGQDEIELVTLLGRFVAAAVQNIRTYEAERATVEELRRLSALRADFVSLVSHELRSPMAAVLGSTRTLQTRWRELRDDQRAAFLAVIGDETSRLSALVEDVLDTSRIEAGTFGYSFTDVDLSAVLREAASAAELGQDEVRLAVEIPPSLPPIRGDRERLRQLVDNLLANAIKYSERGGEVEVDASARNGSVSISRPRLRTGNRARGSRPDLREVRAGGGGQRQARDRARALPLALVRGGSRRHPARRIAPRRGRDLHAHSARKLSIRSRGCSARRSLKGRFRGLQPASRTASSPGRGSP